MSGDPFKVGKPEDKKTKRAGAPKGKAASKAYNPFSNDNQGASITGQAYKSDLERVQKQYIRERNYSGAKAYLRSKLIYIDPEKRTDIQENITKNHQQSIIEDLPISQARKYIADHKAELERDGLNPDFLTFNLDITELLLDDKHGDAIALLETALKTGKVAGKGLGSFEKTRLLGLLAHVVSTKDGDPKNAIKLLEQMIADKKITIGDNADKREYKLDDKALDQIKKTKLSLQLADAPEVEDARNLLKKNEAEARRLLEDDGYEEQLLELEYKEVKDKEGVEAEYKKTQEAGAWAKLEKAFGKTGAMRFVEQLKIECLISGKPVDGVIATGPAAAIAYINDNKLEFLKTADQGGRYRFSQKEIGLLLKQAELQSKQANREKSAMALGCVRPDSFGSLPEKIRREIFQRLEKRDFIDANGKVNPNKLKAFLKTTDPLLVRYSPIIYLQLQTAYSIYRKAKDLGMQVDKQIKLANLNETLEYMPAEEAPGYLKSNESFLRKSLTGPRYEKMEVQFKINAALTSTKSDGIAKAEKTIRDDKTIKLFLGILEKKHPDKYNELIKLINDKKWIAAEVLIASWRGKNGLDENYIKDAFDYIRMRRSIEDIRLSFVIRGIPSQFDPYRINEELKVGEKDLIYGKDKNYTEYVTALQRRLSAVADEQETYYLVGQEGEGKDWKWGEMNWATAYAMYRFLAREGQENANADLLLKLAKKEVAELKGKKLREISIPWSNKNFSELQAAYGRIKQYPQSVAVPLGSTRLGLEIKLEGKREGAGTEFFKTGFILVMVLYLQDALKKVNGAAEKLQRIKAWVEQGKAIGEKDLQWLYDQASTVEVKKDGVFVKDGIEHIVKKAKNIKTGLKVLPRVLVAGTTIAFLEEANHKELNKALLETDLGKALVDYFRRSGEKTPSETFVFSRVHFVYALLLYMQKADPSNKAAYERILKALAPIRMGDSPATDADYKLLGEKVVEVAKHGLDYKAIDEIVRNWDPKTQSVNLTALAQKVVWVLPDGSFRPVETANPNPSAATVIMTSRYRLQTMYSLSSWAERYVQEGGKLHSYGPNNWALPLYLTHLDITAMAEHEGNRPLECYAHYPLVVDRGLGEFLAGQLADPKLKDVLEKLLADRTILILLREQARLAKSVNKDDQRILAEIKNLVQDEESMEARIEAIIKQSGAGTSDEASDAVKRFFLAVREEQKRIKKNKHLSPAEVSLLAGCLPRVPQELKGNFERLLKSIYPDNPSGFSKEDSDNLNALAGYLKKNNLTLDYKLLKKLAAEKVAGASILLDRVDGQGAQAIVETSGIAQTIRNLGLNGKPERGRIMLLKLEWAKEPEQGFDVKVAALKKRHAKLAKNGKDPKDELTMAEFEEFKLVEEQLNYFRRLIDSDEVTKEFLDWFLKKYVSSKEGVIEWVKGKYGDAKGKYGDYVDMKNYIDTVTKEKMGPGEAAEFVLKYYPQMAAICPQWKIMGRFFSLDSSVVEGGGVSDPQLVKRFKQAVAFLININADNKKAAELNGGSDLYGEELNGLLTMLPTYGLGEMMKRDDLGAYDDYVFGRKGVGQFTRHHVGALAELVKRMQFEGKDELVAELEALKNDKSAYDNGNLILDPDFISKIRGRATDTFWSNSRERTLVKAMRALYGIGEEDKIPNPTLSDNPKAEGILGFFDRRPGLASDYGFPFLDAEWRRAVWEGLDNARFENILEEAPLRILAQQWMLRYLMILNIYIDLPILAAQEIRNGNVMGALKNLVGLAIWPRLALLWYRDLWDEMASENPNYAKCLVIYMAVNFLTLQGGWDSTWGRTIKPLNEALRLAKKWVPGLEPLITKIFRKAEELQKSDNPKARKLGKILEHGLIRGSMEGWWKDGYESRNPRAGRRLRNLARLFTNPIGLILQNDLLFTDGRVSAEKIRGLESYFVVEEGRDPKFREGLTEDDIKATGDERLLDLWKESHNDKWDYGRLARLLMENNNHRLTVRWAGKGVGFVLGHAGIGGYELLGMAVDFAKRGIGFPFSWGASLVEALMVSETRSPIIVHQLKKAGTSLHMNPTDILAGVEIREKWKIVAVEGEVDANVRLKKDIKDATDKKGNLAELWQDGEFKINGTRISSIRVIKGQTGNTYRVIGDGTAVLSLGENYNAVISDEVQNISSKRAEADTTDRPGEDTRTQAEHDAILDGNGRKERAEKIRSNSPEEKDRKLAEILREHEIATRDPNKPGKPGVTLRHIQLQALMLLDEGIQKDGTGEIQHNVLLQIGTGEGKLYVTFYAAMMDLDRRIAEWEKLPEATRGPKPKAYILTIDDVLVNQGEQEFRRFEAVFARRGLKVGFRYQNSKNPMDIYRNYDIIVVNVAQHAFDLTTHASEIVPGTIIGDEFDFYALETAATSYIQSMQKGQTGNPLIDRITLSRVRGKWATAKKVFKRMMNDPNPSRFFAEGKFSREGIEFIRKGMGKYDFFVQMQFKALLQAGQLITEKGLLGQEATGETALSQEKKFKVTYRDKETGQEYSQEEVLTSEEMSKRIAAGRFLEGFRRSGLVPIKIVPIEDSGAESPNKSYGRGVDEALKVLLGMKIEAEHITSADINISEVFRHHSHGGGRILGVSGSIGESATTVQALFPKLNFGAVKVRSFVPRIEITGREIDNPQELSKKLAALEQGIKDCLEVSDDGVFAKLVIKGATDEQVKTLKMAWEDFIKGKDIEAQGKKVSVVRSNRYFVRSETARFEAIAKEAQAMRRAGRPVLLCVESHAAAQKLIRLLGGKDNVNLLAKKPGDPAAFTKAMKRAGENGVISITLFSRGLDLQIDQLTYEIKGSGDSMVEGGLHVISVGAQTRAKAVQQIGRGGRSTYPGSASEYFGEGDRAYSTLDESTRKELEQIPEAKRVDLEDGSKEAEKASRGTKQGYNKLYDENYRAIKRNFEESTQRAELMKTIRSLRGHSGSRTELARAVVDSVLDYLFDGLEIKDGEILTDEKRTKLESKLSKLLGGRKINIGVGKRRINVSVLKSVISQKLVKEFGALRQGDPGADQKVKLGDGTERYLFELKLEGKIGDANGEISSVLENLAHEGYSEQSKEDAEEEMERYTRRRTAGLLHSLMGDLFPTWSAHNPLRRGTHTFSAIKVTLPDYQKALPASVPTPTATPAPAPVQTPASVVVSTPVPAAPVKTEQVKITMVSEKWEALERGEGVVSRDRVVVKHEGKYYVFPLGTSGLNYEFKNGKHVFSKNGSSSSFDSTEVLILSVNNKHLPILNEVLPCEAANVSRRAPRARVGGMGLGGLSFDRILTITGPAEPIAETIAPGVKRMPDGAIVVDGEKITLEEALKNSEIKDTDTVRFEGKDKIKVRLLRKEIIDVHAGRAEDASPLLKKKAQAALRRSFERAKKRDNGVHSDQIILDKVLYGLEQGIDLLETETGKNRFVFSVPVFAVEGSKADMRAEELEMKIKVKPRPRYRTSRKPVAEVEVTISRKDMQILIVAAKDSKEYTEALGRIRKAVKDAKIEGVSVDEVVQKQLDEIEQGKKEMLIRAGQNLFMQWAGKEGDKILNEELAKIDPSLSPEEFIKAQERAAITARMAMMAKYQSAFEALLEVANRKDSANLSQREVETEFNRIMAKSAETPVPKGEEWEKQIEETTLRINEQLKAVNPEGRGVAAYFGAIQTGAPGASTKVKLKIVGASMVRGFVLGAVVGDLTVAATEAYKAYWNYNGSSLLDSLWVGTEVFSDSFFNHKFAHARGFIKFEAMNTTAKLFLGLNKFWAQAAAIGLPQLWELRNTPYEQRGVVGIAGTANLGMFFVASYGAGAALKRLIGAAPLPWWQKAFVAGLPLLVGQQVGNYATEGVMALYASSETAKFIIDNPATRVALTAAAVSSPSVDTYLASRILLGAGSLALTTAAAGLTAFFWGTNGDFHTNTFHGDLGSLAEGEYLRGRSSDAGSFRPENLDFSKMTPRLQPVYWQLAVSLYHKGFLTEERLYQFFASSMASHQRVLNPGWLNGNGENKEARELAKKLNLLLDNTNLEDNSEAGQKKNAEQFKQFVQILEKNPAQNDALFLGALKAAVQKFQKVQASKGSLLEEALPSKVRGNLRQAYVDFRVAAETKRVEYIHGLSSQHAKMVYEAGRKNIGGAIEQALLAKVDRSDRTAVMLAKKQAEHIAYFLRRENIAILPEADKKAYFEYLKKEHGVKDSELGEYLKEKKFVEFYAKYHFKVKGPKDMIARYLKRDSGLPEAERIAFESAYRQYLTEKGKDESCYYHNGIMMSKSATRDEFVRIYVGRIYSDNSAKVKEEAQKMTAKIGKTFDEFNRAYRGSGTEKSDHKEYCYSPASKWFLSDLSVEESRAFAEFLKAKYGEGALTGGEVSVGPSTLRLLLRK